ncbi:polyprenol phosphomannose-dependent alpha 1,6 mannosyltransferase MptB [Actinoplanes sp. NPDC051343]|jgi:alpha-1,6-mannosyltransferase|uniref:polyprenol phosphomannose-dependent alpha 1,6 mannosyltransferase MptB n=1 Tax=Actinoplanes sp. NPDC051343 TaxID=3363906 RepID=UPI00378BDD81
MFRPAVVRYVGLAGSLLLAIAAYRGGARSPWHPTMTPTTIFHGTNGVLAPLSWLLGTVFLIGAWWAGRRSVPSARWAYVTAGLWALPLLFFLPLGSYDAYSYACQGWQQAAGLDPYAGGVDLVGCPWRDAVAPTWLSSPAPYGPVFLVLAGAAAKLGGSLVGTLIALRVIAVAGVGLIAVSLPALARRSGVPLSRAVWLALACPLVPIHLISGAHNDAVMVGFVVAALALAADRKLLLAGLFFGLAVGVKATAIVAVPFAVLLWMNGDQRKMLLRASAELLLGVVGVLVLVTALSGRGLGWITGLEGSGVSVQWTSPSTAVGIVFRLFGVDAVPVTRVIGIAALVIVLVALWWRAQRADPLLYAGLALAATVVLAPVFHPWYATWPLAVLAATVRRETLWLVLPPAVAAALCLPDGYNLALATRTQGAVLMTLFLLVLAVRAAWPSPRWARTGP